MKMKNLTPLFALIAGGAGYAIGCGSDEDISDSVGPCSAGECRDHYGGCVPCGGKGGLGGVGTGGTAGKGGAGGNTSVVGAGGASSGGAANGGVGGG